MSQTPVSPKNTQKGTQAPRTKKAALDSACHRLSRVPQKFSTSKAIQAEKSEPYAVSYFKSNPEAGNDIRSPDEKLDEVEESLQNPSIEPSERFALLVKQKALRYIQYGEKSPEAVESLVALGTFYNENNRPESGIRHLSKAKELVEKDGVQVEPDVKAQIGIELANAHLTYKQPKHTNIAYENVAPFEGETIEDPYYAHMLALDLAKCLNFKKEYKAANKHYQVACATFEQANEYQLNSESDKKAAYDQWAKLCQEGANNAEEAKDLEKEQEEIDELHKSAQDFYKQAVQHFEEAGNPKMADALREKIENDPEPEPEPESQPSKEGEQENQDEPAADEAAPAVERNVDEFEEEEQKKETIVQQIIEKAGDVIDENQ